MKILWVTYDLLGRSAKILHNSSIQGGAWIDACADALVKNYKDIELSILSLGKSNKAVVDIETKINYIETNEIKKIRGTYDNSQEKKWEKIIDDIKPDIIQVFGTEFSSGLSLLNVRHDIPKLIFIQGIVGKIYECYYGELKLSDLKIKSLLGLLSFLKFVYARNNLKKQIKYEQKMIKLASGVISDNEWADNYCEIVGANRIFYQTLPVNNIFLSKKWSLDKCTKFRIFTVAGRSPYKGLHILLKAIPYIKIKYPMCKVVIPGSNSSNLFSDPYFRYLKNLINELNIVENIEFIGKLDSVDMAVQMEKCHIFVLPSSIENHSSTLREAMYIGVPCIASFVGGINDFCVHKYNSMIFRSGEIITLAYYINKLFGNNEVTQYISDNAYNSIRKKYNQEQICHEIHNIYKSMMA